MAGFWFWPEIIVQAEDLPIIYSDEPSGFWYQPAENVTELNSNIEELRLAVIEDLSKLQVHLDTPVAISSSLETTRHQRYYRTTVPFTTRFRQFARPCSH